jgi:uncharacterized protein (DUF952 family)
VILHLAPAAEWDAVPAGGAYAPAALATDGFVHCTGDDDTLLAVANAYYRDVPGEMVVLTLDEARVDAEVRWEAPSPAPPQGSPVTLFPHVFGPLPRAAVVAERRLVRDDGGAASGYAPRT